MKFNKIYSIRSKVLIIQSLHTYKGSSQFMYQTSLLLVDTLQINVFIKNTLS